MSAPRPAPLQVVVDTDTGIDAAPYLVTLVVLVLSRVRVRRRLRAADPVAAENAAHPEAVVHPEESH